MENAVVSDLAVGSVFVGRYRVERRIAAGGMGAVYEVVHIETNRRRALKVMHAHYVSSDELRARFRLEARVAAEVESEHIVEVFDAGIDEATGMPFLVMELLRGDDLGKLVKRVGPLPREDVVRYLYETSLALDQTHLARIVHRDLKPDNLFLSERGRGRPRVKVLDFGIAKIVKDAQTQANATRALGTPLYMAPEQFLLQSAVSAATDIFALGMIAFTLLVGKPYWFKESKMAGEPLAFAIHTSRGPTESAVARAWELYGVELPKNFDAWFFRATAPNPTHRFTTAGEAIMALAAVLGVSSPNDEESQTQSAIIEPHVTTAILTQGNSSNDAATILLPSVNASSPSGPLPTAPTQLALAGSSKEPAGNSSKRPNRSRSFLLLGFGASVAAGLFVWFVFKGFGTPSQVEKAEPAMQSSAIAGEAHVETAQSAPSTADSVAPKLEPSAFTSPPEIAPSATSIALETPVTSTSPPAPAVSAITPTGAVRPSVPGQVIKKTVTPADGLPDD